MKMSYSDNDSCVGMLIGFAIWGFIVSTIWACLAFWNDRNLDFWVSHFKGQEVDVPFWISGLSAILFPVSFVFNLIAEVGRFII